MRDPSGVTRVKLLLFFLRFTHHALRFTVLILYLPTLSPFVSSDILPAAV